MRPTASTLTPRELELMNIVWRQNTGVTVREVYEELRSRRSVAYTTVLTTLKTLEQKRYVTSTVRDRANVYKPTRPRHAVVGSMVREFVDRVFNGSARPLVLHLLEDERLTEAELTELTRRVGKKR